MIYDLLPELDSICNFIYSHRGSDVSNVLVPCNKGVSRSATALVAYLMRTHRWDYDTALAFVEKKRRIKPNKNFKEQLQVWGTIGYEIWADSEGRVPKPEYTVYLEGRTRRLQECGLTGDEPIGVLSL
ncbi:protein-tyrosine phosphatase-like protein [Apiosordaria backusii]|uniref:protein-tyrosine-phosphatase n=1 Tax=Apiosordaria backusii TaxID=314023 RepID=A0AA40EE45_9PEZI|nr:protein-tyrosine phosphatase-like protein [Apiosordaria backusii]